MQEFKITYFFDEAHYIRRFIHKESFEDAITLIQSERDRYVSFEDSRGIYHELHTKQVRVIQLSTYNRVAKPVLIQKHEEASPYYDTNDYPQDDYK